MKPTLAAAHTGFDPASFAVNEVLTEVLLDVSTLTLKQVLTIAATSDTVWRYFAVGDVVQFVVNDWRCLFSHGCNALSCSSSMDRGSVYECR